MKRLYNRHTKHDGIHDNDWRKLLGAAIDTYLAPEYDPSQEVDVLHIARTIGIQAVESPSLYKVELYAAGAAAIHLQTRHWLQGTGKEARVEPKWLPDPESVVINPDDPFGSYTSLLRRSYHTAGIALEEAGTTHLTHILNEYDEYARRGLHMADAAHLRNGGSLAYELEHFSRITARALGNAEPTRKYDEAQRIDAAHQLLSLFNSRATQSVENFGNGRMDWAIAERSNPHIVQAETKSGRAKPETAEAAGQIALLELLGPNGKALFPAAMELISASTPLLKCPAHQRIGGAESALQSQLHAGVNYLADNGLFHPNLIIPPVG